MTNTQFLNWELATERMCIRSSELRSRTGTEKDDECLNNKHWSKAQLEHWTEMAYEYCQR